MEITGLGGESRGPSGPAAETREIVAEMRENYERVARSAERTAEAATVAAQAAGTAADVAQRRTPSQLETFAISVASTASAIVLAGVVLIVIADAVNLVDSIDVWPLVALALAIVAIAAVSGTAGWRRAIDLIPGTRDMQRKPGPRRSASPACSIAAWRTSS